MSTKKNKKNQLNSNQTKPKQTKPKQLKKYQDDMKDIIPHLESFGFSGIQFTSTGKWNAFKCDQIGETCPCCRNQHDRNSYHVWLHEPSEGWYVKNFSKKCASKRFHTENQLKGFAFSQ